MTMLTRRAAIGALAATPFAAPAIATPWRAGPAGRIRRRLRRRRRHGHRRAPVRPAPRTAARPAGDGGEPAGRVVRDRADLCVARSRPDGHVIGLTNMPSFVTIPVERRAQYNLDSFTFVGNIMTDATGFMVKADGPIRDMADLVRARPRAARADRGLDLRHRHRRPPAAGDAGTRDRRALHHRALQRRAAAAQCADGRPGAGRTWSRSANTRRTRRACATSPMPAPSAAASRPRRRRCAAWASTSRCIPSAASSCPPARRPPIVERLREAVQDAAEDPATRATFEAQFIEPTYEPGQVWEARMRRVQGVYADLWRRQPWRASFRPRAGRRHRRLAARHALVAGGRWARSRLRSRIAAGPRSAFPAPGAGRRLGCAHALVRWARLIWARSRVRSRIAAGPRSEMLVTGVASARPASATRARASSGQTSIITFISRLSRIIQAARPSMPSTIATDATTGSRAARKNPASIATPSPKELTMLSP